MRNIKKGLDLGYSKYFTNITFNQNRGKNLISITFALKDSFDALAWYEC